MQRIAVLLQKLQSLQEREGAKTVLDADLMLDYLRVLYADVLEWRDGLAAKQALPLLREPTLDELTAAFAGAADEEDAATAPAQFLKPAQPQGQQAAGTLLPKLPEVKKTDVQNPEFRTAKDFQKAVGINDRILFMNELFGGSQEKYNQMAAAMNAAQTLAEARGWLVAHAGLSEQEEDITSELFFGLLRRFYTAHSK